MSIDPTGRPPMRRIGSSVEFVRRKRSGVTTFASAKAIIDMSLLFKENSITEHMPL